MLGFCPYGSKMYTKFAWSVNRDTSFPAVSYSSSDNDSTTAKDSFSKMLHPLELPLNEPERKASGS